MTQDDAESRPGRSHPPSAVHLGNGHASLSTTPSIDLLTEIVQASPVPMILTELESGLVVSANHLMQTILGYPAEELAGQVAPNLYYHPEDRRAIVKLIREKGSVQDRELWSRRRDGSPVRTILSSQRVVCDGVELLITGFSDLTALTQAQAEVRRHQEELAHVTRLNMLGEMASGLAHELNQPLSAISNYAAGLTKRLDAGPQDPAVVRDALSRIREQAKRGGEMIKRLRSMVAKRPAKNETVEVNAVVRNVLELCGFQIMEQQVKVGVHLDPQNPLIRVDPIQIEQVLINLIQNAIDAMAQTPKDKRKIQLRTCRIGQNKIVISVRDDGQPLSQPQLDSVFEPFFTTKDKGMGMGLAISESIALTHGGGLTARANPARGATFTLTLPMYSPKN